MTEKIKNVIETTINGLIIHFPNDSELFLRMAKVTKPNKVQRRLEVSLNRQYWSRAKNCYAHDMHDPLLAAAEAVEDLGNAEHAFEVIAK